MISFERAQKLIEENIPPLKQETVSLSHALGAVMAQDLYAPLPLPISDNSAMDGYALRSQDTTRAHSKKSISLRIAGVLKAGDGAKRSLGREETYRIMTGALLPKGADTVVPKEQAIVKEGCLIADRPVEEGNHIRWKGEEIRKGDWVLKKGAAIHPGTIGILASLGKSKVTVFKKPRVSLIATGSELISSGRPLTAGKIYDSNSWMIVSALKMMNLIPLFVRTLRDHPRTLRKGIRDALRKSDVVILTGGVSVGDSDYVKRVLSQLGVRTIFWGVRQKPGKPLYFGRRRNTLVFGLPGNPASVFTCFYEYVFPALRRMLGFANPSLPRLEAVMQKSVKADRTKVLFLKGKTDFTQKGKRVTPLPYQGSHMISSLRDTDSLIVVPPQRGKVKSGQKVSVHLLP